MAPELDKTFLDYLCSTTGLPRAVCSRLALDVLNEYSETLDGFVKRRHTDLKANTDLKNEQIYEQIAAEIPARLFAVDNLSTRQIRRLIYG
jgi:hypothetical protein